MIPTINNAYAGEVSVVLGGAVRRFRFGLNTLRDYSALTGGQAGGFAFDLQQDYALALTNLVYCGVKRYVPAAELPADFSIDYVADWLDELSEEDGEKLATALQTCLNPLTSPLVKALLNKTAAPAPSPEAPATDGTSASTSLLVS